MNVNWTDKLLYLPPLRLCSTHICYLGSVWFLRELLAFNGGFFLQNTETTPNTCFRTWIHQFPQESEESEEVGVDLDVWWRVRMWLEKWSRDDKEKLQAKDEVGSSFGRERGKRPQGSKWRLGLTAGIKANKIFPAGTGREPRSHASTQLCSLLASCDGPH